MSQLRRIPVEKVVHDLIHSKLELLGVDNCEDDLEFLINIEEQVRQELLLLASLETEDELDRKN